MAASKDLVTFTDFSRNRAPIYLQIASVFRRFITSGQWRVGDRLPTHDALAIQFDVNPATVRKALSLLNEEGLVAPYRRHGTFVTGRPTDEAWINIPTQGNEIFSCFAGLESTWLSGGMAQAMEWPVPEGAKRTSAYYRMDRLYTRETRPAVLEEAYLAEDVKRAIGLRPLKRSLTLRLLDEGLCVHRITQRVRFGVADQALAERLQIELNAPVAIMELWVLDSSKTVVYFSVAHYRGDLIRILETIAPPGSRSARKRPRTRAR